MKSTFRAFAGRMLREPLLHFLVIGLLLFAWYGRSAGDDDPRRIVVRPGELESIAAQFSATWGRAPAPSERQALTESWVRDEILYREGKALGLAEGDPVIKRRVRQKFEVLSEESAASAPPTDAELAAYLAANPDTFREPAHVTFAQVLVAAQGSDALRVRAAEAARRELERGADPDTVGLPTMLPRRESDRPVDLVARDFGEDFAAALEALPIGQWSAPVESGFGWHLVRIEARQPGRLPPLDAVRPAVLREWESARRRSAREADYRRMRERYEVVVAAEPPAGAAP